ncbi:P-II family nitrogen regulator [Chloroflexus aggregans]|uniref:Nitrogen regulatory protein P-II n=1 Tax=Chloroflexus aggregans (strain MD-66 / DSM 9485) TaxID=326427 RepID=B8G8P9_CHLAD|nr:nitrogen regulatory protein P-II [Chloroflexus aggregans]ACL24311.1 nitrogen regulatory protein P-II [Chloroflexus aggregans DSM 9485]
MELTTVKLVTIISEAILEERILHDLRKLGARGYTVGEVRGEGTRGVHASEWEGKSLRIETLVKPEVAEQILQHLAHTYFPHFAVIAYMTDVQVVRGDKFHGERT